MTATEEDLLSEFRTAVYNRAAEVDPDEERMWFDIAYGYFMAKGLEPEAAYALATTARYKAHIA